METNKQKEEIKKLQEQRQKPLTDRDDAMEGLENVFLDIIHTQELYEDFDIEIPFKKITK
jgi:hypothetical protein